MSKDYKSCIYEGYVTNHASNFHDTVDIEREYRVESRYFKKNYLKFMPKDKQARILDVGCGLGHFLSFCKDAGYENALGIDLSDEEIKFCKARNFNVIKADAVSYLSENKDTFDCIVFNDVIEHLGKQEIFDTLTLMKEALSGGGGY